MNRTSGNNAIKGEYLSGNVRYGTCGKGKTSGKTVKLTVAKKAKTVKLPAQINEARSEAERRIHNKYARKKFFAFSSFLILVAFATFAFTGILVRNARILELNYSNVRLERQIDEIKAQTGDMREEFAKTVDPEKIRSIAMGKYGMRDPAQIQKITVNIPEGDRIVYGSTSLAVSEEESDDDLFKNLEGFFKTMR